ncbi:hypothetical protein OG401_22265 [Kitasatospora purpeofusca]|uniref:hypothetical protein n=1 Tax=Kitasatospora purpeofusca TaxID=67352 RepID=UPI002257B0C4|nr:hypothetical protein [Kitasatospora purpeofusca]MCX4686993.1 hypothetical protein [Kitasatospora purpeofusca]
MSSMEKTRTAAVAIATGAVPVVVGSAAGWPVWLWTVAGVAGALLVLLASAARVRPAPRPVATPPLVAAPPPPYAQVLPPTPEPPVEQPYQETSVVGVALPSAVPDYDFLFSATVWWRRVPGTTGVAHAAPGSLAIEAVLARARAVTEGEHPGRPELVRHRLDGVLGLPSPDTSGIVVVMAGRVSLGVPVADRERLDKLADVRKAEEIWDHERRHERSKRAYLGEDVLRSPGSAVVWWLARNDEQVRGAVDMIGPLAQLSAAANDRAVDVLYEHLVAPAVGQAEEVAFLDLVAPRAVAGNTAAVPVEPAAGPSVVGPLNSLMDDIDLREDGERTVYAHRVARVTDALGRSDAAARIRGSLGGGGGDVIVGAPSSDGPGAGGAPGRPAFPVGPVRPADGDEVDGGAAVASAWDVLRGAVGGEARGTGGVASEGWGGADQSHE